MIKKLRRKFIIINMLFVSIVLVCVFVAVLTSTSQTLTNDIYRCLTQAVEDKGKAPWMAVENEEPGPGRNMIKRDNKNPKFISVYAFYMTDDGEVINTIQSADLLDESDLNDVAKLVTEGAYEAVSELDEYNLYYYKRMLPNGFVAVSLADSRFYYNSISSLLMYSLAIGILSLVAFFFISLFLSKWALKPVEKAWVQQKQFIADASHELKTPLTVILANTRILSDNKNQTIENQMQWLDSTKAEAENMKSLVESMLFLARSDAEFEQTKMIINDVSLSDLTESAALQFEPVAYERCIDLETAIEDNVLIKGDSSQLNRLLQILLDNACKYTPENGKIIIKLTKNRLSVFNTGAPIPKESLPHLFERFYRADKARSDRSSFGLGLSIAKTIAVNHGGDLSVESSELIGGSIFTFSFD